MDYVKLLDICKKKVDMILDNTDFTSVLCEESSTDESGKYTSRKVDFLNSKNQWTHSFLSGMVAHLYYHYKDPRYLEYLEQSFNTYKSRIYNHLDEISHDTGFVYCLYAVAFYKLTGKNEVYELALKAADEYSKRFHWRSGIVQGFMKLRDNAPMTIIDDLMNLSLTIFAYNETNNLFYEEIFKTHIQTISEHVLRDDFTFKHAFAFDDATGKPIGERNYCGFANGSVWARGQAWGLHGFVNALRVTNNEEIYGFHIDGILNKLIEMIPEDGIPWWDMRCVGETTNMVDTSAAVIMAVAVEKLRLYKQENPDYRFYREKFDTFADRILDTLVEKYMAKAENENILEGGQCGAKNTGVIWGDYFFVELLMLKIYGKDALDFWA